MAHVKDNTERITARLGGANVYCTRHIGGEMQVVARGLLTRSYAGAESRRYRVCAEIRFGGQTFPNPTAAGREMVLAVMAHNPEQFPTHWINQLGFDGFANMFIQIPATNTYVRFRTIFTKGVREGREPVNLNLTRLSNEGTIGEVIASPGTIVCNRLVPRPAPGKYNMRVLLDPPAKRPADFQAKLRLLRPTVADVKRFWAKVDAYRGEISSAIEFQSDTAALQTFRGMSEHHIGSLFSDDPYAAKLIFRESRPIV